MRLVCPNCSAQYEIDGSMIPDEGRDVQCSNCGHTWFELPPPAADFEASPEEPLEQAVDTVADPVETADASTDEMASAFIDDSNDEDAEREVSEIIEAYADDEDDAPDIQEDGPDEDESPSNTIAAAAMAALLDKSESKATAEPDEMKPRRPADAAALDILREEAEREMSQRRAPEAGALETQADLGLDDLESREAPSRALQARNALLGEGESEGGGRTAAEAPSAPPLSRRPSAPRSDVETYEEPRRDLLPDIDEINSTLKPSARADAATGRSGFLTGFLAMVLIALALVFGYLQAPFIVRLFPESESAMIAYVDQANAFRDWLNALISG